MNSEFVKGIIDSKCSDSDIIVLRGFSCGLISDLQNTFSLIDDYAIENGKIVLELIDSQKLLTRIVSTTGKGLVTYESFKNFSVAFSNFDVLGKKISILENNMMSYYPNPSNADMPELVESVDCQDNINLYQQYYSDCILNDGVQYVEYIGIEGDLYSKNLVSVKLIEPDDFDFTVGEAPNNAVLVSENSDELSEALICLYENMTLNKRSYAFELSDKDCEQIRILSTASKMFGVELNFFAVSKKVDLTYRTELRDLMERVWGYKEFRKLQIYKDLNLSRDIIEISQGSVIETVVRESEKILSNVRAGNVLLTSPTGAGKSLLFQLSAIYLAEKYGFLTIVVSPLVALMEDQEKNLFAKYKGVASLNSTKSLSRKNEIMTQIESGEINILYVAPELLLSYSLQTFLKGRTLGLFVVDEAHTVTTWGRDFRVDYWFLGSYLRTQQKYLPYKFPIFALTATAVWDPSGNNDMVFDTIRSLYMDNTTKFIGVVKRDNIVFEINQANISKGYDKKRNQLTADRIEEAIDNDRKSIFYFPFVKTIPKVVELLESDVSDKVAVYHSRIPNAQKIQGAEEFKTGAKMIMCATKAFGMGVDVSDITEVYHHAPSGSLSDYVQEIGRLARDKELTGIAKVDFSEKDFKFMKQLHGLSAIKEYQLRAVLRKLMFLYWQGGEKRNMLISPLDFAYIFQNYKGDEDDSFDTKLKSCLLLLSNDLENKVRFKALIVRPKTLFTKMFISLENGKLSDFRKYYGKYLKTEADNVFIFDADKLWTERSEFNKYSFPEFKKKIADQVVFEGFTVSIKSKLTILLECSIQEGFDRLAKFFKDALYFINKMSSSHSRLSLSSIKESLAQKKYGKEYVEQFVETFRLVFATNNKFSKEAYCSCHIYNEEKGEEFQCIKTGYEAIESEYLRLYKDFIRENENVFYCTMEDRILKLGELLNSLGIATTQRLGGDVPEIFVRVNNPRYLRRLCFDESYVNDILKSIKEKFDFSLKIFTHFFTTDLSNEQRWDFIEDYFLGASESKLLSY